MRWLFYAGTPLQFYLASRIALMNAKKGDTAEILLNDPLPEADKIAERMVERGIFQCAHYCKPATRMESLRLQAGAFLGKCAFQPNDLAHEFFDYFVFATPNDLITSLVVGLRKVNPKLKIIFYEDGTGSYSGDVFQSSLYLGEYPDGMKPIGFRAKLYRFLSSILPSKLNVYTPDALYLRKPDALSRPIPAQIREIEADVDTQSMVASFFLNVDSSKIKQGIIFLDPPRTPFEPIKDLKPFDELIATCNAKGHVCTLRNHPRTQQISPHANLCDDRSDGLWEALCTQESVSTSILIGTGSTAQLAPYLETGKKPPLIFVHRLLLAEDDPLLEGYESIVDLACNLYGEDADELIRNASTIDEVLDGIAAFSKCLI